jgi:hypothetical protein
MNAPKVILINRMLGFGGLNTALKGQSGKAYGQISRYSPEYKCHIVELSLEEYEAGREDIFKKMRSSMSGFMLWEPQFVLGEAAPSVVPFPALGIDAKMPFNQAVKMAKAAGVKVKKGGSREDLMKAIQEHQASHQAAA